MISYGEACDIGAGDAALLPTSRAEIERALLIVIAAMRDPAGVGALLQTGEIISTACTAESTDQIAVGLMYLPGFLSGEDRALHQYHLGDLWQDAEGLSKDREAFSRWIELQRRVSEEKMALGKRTNYLAFTA